MDTNPVSSNKANNTNVTRARFEEKTESPNNTNVAMVTFDDTPKSSNKANFTKQPATMELLMPMDWARTVPAFNTWNRHQKNNTVTPKAIKNNEVTEANSKPKSDSEEQVIAVLKRTRKRYKGKV